MSTTSQSAPPSLDGSEGHSEPADKLVSYQVHEGRFRAHGRRISWRARRLWSRSSWESRFFSRAASYRSERFAVLRWLVVSLGCLIVLVALAWLIGKDLKSYHVEPFASLAKTVTRPAVALGLAFALLIALAWSFRRVMLAWLVLRGGGIFVPDLQTGGALTSVEPAQPPTPSPAAAPEGAFLDVVTSPDASGQSVVGALLRLLRAAFPSHALEIHGVVREREQSPRYGVTLQVVQKPSQPTSLIKVWDTSWEGAVQQAADQATAAVLPRTRLCRGPWAAWRGYVMPSRLLGAYENASQLELERRFDEAMEQFWEALKLDPTNITLRLRLGQLQEKAGLFLAALVNYQRILVFGAPGAKELPRGLYRRAARREWDRALSLATYRAIVVLGHGSIVESWWETKASTADDIPFRPRLRTEFTPLFEPPAQTTRHNPAADAISKGIKVLNTPEEKLRETSEVELRRELMRCAYKAAHELKLGLPRLELRPRNQPLTRRAVALTQRCIERSYALTTERPEPHDDELTSEHHDVDDLTTEIAKAGRRSKPGTSPWPRRPGRWQWHEHYNAACVYAISLDDPRMKTNDGKDGHDNVAKLAIERLERAITTRDSEFVATWRDWVISEDPDLRPLRSHRHFRAFEAMYFPTLRHLVPTRLPKRPRNSHLLAESRYTRDLLAAVADGCHDLWHARARQRAPEDPNDFVRWCRNEVEIWTLVQLVADDGYDWRRRQQLLKRATELFPTGEPLAVSFSRYDDPSTVPTNLDESAEEDESGDEKASAQRKFAKDRLKVLAALLPGQNKATCAVGDQHFEKWINAMANHRAHPLPRRFVARHPDLCRQHAAIWQALSEWLSADASIPTSSRDSPASDPSSDFQAELRSAVALWTSSTKPS